MKFWIRINGLQEGPMEVEQMKEYNITPTTYVWCAGMKDWAYARDVEDLREVIKHAEEATEAEPAPEAVVTSADEPKTEDVVAEEIGENVEENAVEAEEAESVEHESAEMPEPQPMTEPQLRQTPVQQQVPAEPKKELPCPSNNLIWAILVTIFCCQPFPICGIIAIIYAAQVNSKYYNEGYEAAKKASDRAALWCIISIVVGILGFSIITPFMLFM